MWYLGGGRIQERQSRYVSVIKDTQSNCLVINFVERRLLASKPSMLIVDERHTNQARIGKLLQVEKSSEV